MYDWIYETALKNKGAERDYTAEWEAERCLVGGKMFVMVGGDKEDKPILTLKCDPDNAELLRKQYEDIIPGYYMNKRLWNSIYLEGSVPRELMQKMIADSYGLVFSSLTKKMQAQISLY